LTRPFVPFAFLVVLTAAISPASGAETCSHPESALGVARIVEIDTKSGPLFGDFSKQEKEPRFLGPKEVVLTFDDGPMPRYTKTILDTLDEYCTKATFFYVGEMAMAYPDMVKEVIDRGQTVGAHTWSHPFNLRRTSIDRFKDQLERGFAAVALAAGKPISPFFRFPGLSDSGPMLAYLQERGIAAFTVDVVSNDSYISSPKRLEQRTLAKIEEKDGGIVLFHDIKASTAKALPNILGELKKRGYKIVQLRSKESFTPLPVLTTELEAELAKAEAERGGKPQPTPTFTVIAPSTLEAASEPPVTELAPPARERAKEDASQAKTSEPAPSAEDGTKTVRHVRHRHRVRRKARVSGTIHPVTSLGAAVSGRY